MGLVCWNWSQIFYHDVVDAKIRAQAWNRVISSGVYIHLYEKIIIKNAFNYNKLEI